jgi:hypothetical protein
VTVDLATLLGHDSGLGGELGWTGSVGAESCRRLACDADLTRVLVTRGHRGHPGGNATSNHRGSDAATGHPDHTSWDGSAAGQGRWGWWGWAGGPAAGGPAAAAANPWGAADPAVGGRPRHQGRRPRPTQRAGGARRRLRVSRV